MWEHISAFVDWVICQQGYSKCYQWIFVKFMERGFGMGSNWLDVSGWLVQEFVLHCVACSEIYHYVSLAGAAPAYLANDCRLLSDAGRRMLRSHSNDIRKLLMPQTHNKLGDRSFSAAGPRLWNDLPPGLRWPGLPFDSFRRYLKTHLFGDWSA